jgi:hypothetical protein
MADASYASCVMVGQKKGVDRTPALQRHPQCRQRCVICVMRRARKPVPQRAEEFEEETMTRPTIPKYEPEGTTSVRVSLPTYRLHVAPLGRDRAEAGMTADG